MNRSLAFKAMNGAKILRPSRLWSLRAFSSSSNRPVLLMAQELAQSQHLSRSRIQTLDKTQLARLFSDSTNQKQGKQEEQREQSTSTTSTFPKDKAVAAWLFTVCGLVFLMVTMGGLTRLTRSGLSMTKWRFVGERPPMNQQEWEQEFEDYKQFPEYQKLNRGMTLDEFKFIYGMEWGHRQLGRLIGVVFALPLAYFAARGRLNKQLLKPLGLLFAMGGAQGLIGWWMVKSGLKENKENPHAEPKVSPYRLTVHLVSAFLIYSLLFSTALKTLHGGQLKAMANGVPKKLRSFAVGVSHLVFLTAISGAFVAGNHAGLIYNEFPLMGGRFVPEDIIQPGLEPKWRNLFENSTCVQFDHRVLGMSTAAAVSALWAYSRKFPLSSPARRAANLLFGMVFVQVGLGISTLLMHVPVHLGATHQAGALTMLTLSLYLLHALGPAQGSKALARMLNAPAAQSTTQAVSSTTKRAFSTTARVPSTSSSTSKPSSVSALRSTLTRSYSSVSSSSSSSSSSMARQTSFSSAALFPVSSSIAASGVAARRFPMPMKNLGD